MDVRTVRPADAGQLREIRNHYIRHTVVTFDLEPESEGDTRAWIAAHPAESAHPIVVLEDEGALLGYASAGPLRSKPAYAYAVETSVYTSPESIGRGLGRALYQELFRVLQGRVHRAYACIALPHAPSIRLHQDFGFTECGEWNQAGRKFGRWIDVLWMERALPGGVALPEEGEEPPTLG